MIDDQYIINKFYIKDNRCGYRISGKTLNNITEEEYNYVINRFIDSSSIKESIQRIYYKIEEKNKCPICGKPVLWLGKQKRLMLHTCSLECGFKLRQKHNEEHWQSVANVSNVFATKECVQKIKKTKLIKYGDENYHNIDLYKKTCLEKYGYDNAGSSPEIIETNKQYFLKKYGETTPFKVEECKQKIKATCIKKYGYDNPAKNSDIKDKIKQTCLNKYGKTTYLYSDEYNKHKIEYRNKRKETLKKHNKLTQSKAEVYIYNLFTHYFKDIKCQYYCERYPFNCDFYIPEIDTFIEYQGYYTHGNHPYNKRNVNDINELNKLIEKNLNHKKYNNNLYFIKIKTWTISDVNKRNIAKQNKLNYIEFWNYDEVINWLKNYEKKY